MDVSPLGAAVMHYWCGKEQLQGRTLFYQWHRMPRASKNGVLFGTRPIQFSFALDRVSIFDLFSPFLYSGNNTTLHYKTISL